MQLVLSKHALLVSTLVLWGCSPEQTIEQQLLSKTDTEQDVAFQTVSQNTESQNTPFLPIEDTSEMVLAPKGLENGFKFLNSRELNSLLMWVVDKERMLVGNRSSITVCFVDRNYPRYQKEIIKYVLAWEAPGSNIKFDVLGKGGIPNQCGGGEPIRITLQGYSLGAEVGKGYTAIAPKKATVRLGRIRGFKTKEERRRWTIHEIGHALGLLHEYQTEESGCINDLLDKEKLRKYLSGEPEKWTPKQIKKNLEIYTSQSLTRNYGLTDYKSIMMYSFPEQFYKPNSKCVVKNYDLSDGDIKFIVHASNNTGPFFDLSSDDGSIFDRDDAIQSFPVDADKFVSKEMIFQMLEQEFSKKNTPEGVREQAKELLELYLNN